MCKDRRIVYCSVQTNVNEIKKDACLQTSLSGSAVP